MANKLLVGLIVVLIILVVIAAVIVLWLRADLINCETTESPYCPQFTCATPDGSGNNNGTGTPARRRLPDSECTAANPAPCYEYST